MARSGHAGLKHGLSVLIAAAVALLLGTMILGSYGGDWRPSHFDEWRSVALAQRALDSGSLSPELPAGSPNGLARDINDRNRSLGFAALVSVWLAWAPEPIAAFKTLALLFLLLYGTGLYWLCRSLGTGPGAALLAVLTLAGLPTDTMLLGPALAVPSSLSLGLLCLALIAHTRLSVAKPGASLALLGLLGASSVALALIYPLSLFVFGGLVLADTMSRPKILRTRYFRSLATLGLAGVGLFLVRELGSDHVDRIAHLGELFFLERRWHLVGSIVYPLGYLIAPPVLGLAAVGACLALAQPGLRWVAAFFWGTLIAIGGYHFFARGLVVPYQRLGLYLGLATAVCTGLATQQLFNLLKQRPLPQWVSYGLTAALGLAIVGWPRPGPPFERTTRLDRPAPAIEQVAARIAAEYSAPSTLWSAPRHAFYLEALTGLRVSPNSIDSLLTGHPPPPLNCDDGWTLVVGPCSCPNYSLAFIQQGIPVFARRSPLPRGPATP
ncbi:MAG: hypothetical protein OSB70_01335 [Myxococcota bacterium]|nr:hypothetical protein [Myxococcota bacterium]